MTTTDLKVINYQGKKLLSPKYDCVFKCFFVDKDLTLLASFLSSVLDMKIVPNQLRITNPEIFGERADGKHIRLDIRIELADGGEINVEMQMKDKQNMGKRSVFHLSQMMAEQLSEGKDYKNICPVIAINVLCFNYIKETADYHSRFRMKDVKTSAEMPNAEVFEINFIELPKLPKRIGKNMKELWARFFAAETEEEFMMLKNKSPVFDKAVNKLGRISAGKKARVLKQLAFWGQLDRNSDISEARDKGIAQGIETIISFWEKGGSLNDAKRMFAVSN